MEMIVLCPRRLILLNHKQLLKKNVILQEGDKQLSSQEECTSTDSKIFVFYYVPEQAVPGSSSYPALLA
jgi:hypothetical protein